MSLPQTDRARLLDGILRAELGDGLDDVVVRLNKSGLGVRAIADRLTRYTGVRVSYRTVARWLAEARKSAVKDAA